MNKSKQRVVMMAALVAVVPALAAPESTKSAAAFHHYKVVDLGTFGGSFSQFSTPSVIVINNKGMSVGVADTNIPDPNCFFDCLVDLPFLRQGGVTTPLPTLPGGQSAFAYGINNAGVAFGQGQDDIIDPLTGAPELRSIVWKDGQAIDLGTFGGNASDPFAINSSGEVVGSATTTKRDPYANAPMTSCHAIPTQVCPDATFAFSALFTVTTTQTHAFLWRNGVLKDLGTLGGPDSNAEMINEHGDITGWSYTSFKANPTTGVPQVDPFFWSSATGKMTDMGSLGGTFSAPYWLNNRGQVVGGANLAGDQIVHPFLWSQATGMQDIGTLGGDYGHGDWINDAGDIVGLAETADGLKRAFFWHAGTMQNVGTVGTDKDSEATSINSHGEVVGESGDFEVADAHGFIWHQSATIKDLNALAVKGTTIQVVSATNISELGEIAGVGQLPNGDRHAVVLIPCDEQHPGITNCDYQPVGP